MTFELVADLSPAAVYGLALMVCFVAAAAITRKAGFHEWTRLLECEES